LLKETLIALTLQYLEMIIEDLNRDLKLSSKTRSSMISTLMSSSQEENLLKIRSRANLIPRSYWVVASKMQAIP